MTKILCLDLGTNTGFAAGSSGAVVSGTWNLKQSRFDGAGMRFVKLRTRLNEVQTAYGAEVVFFEEVRRHAGTDAAHAYGGYLAMLQAWCEEHKVPYEGVPVGEIKKSWTGKGNADKAAMLAEAWRRGFSPKDDNEADALALFHLAVTRA